MKRVFFVLLFYSAIFSCDHYSLYHDPVVATLAGTNVSRSDDVGLRFLVVQNELRPSRQRQQKKQNNLGAYIRRGPSAEQGPQDGYATEQQQFDHDFFRAVTRFNAGNTAINSLDYILTPAAYSILDDIELDSAAFTRCTGNIIQLQKHAEIVYLANEFSSFCTSSRSQAFIHTMYGFIDAARECNGDGLIKSTIKITDFCWDMLEHVSKSTGAKYVGAVGLGTIDGVLSVAHTLRHPDVTIQNVGSALYNGSAFLAGIVADIALNSTALDDYHIGQFIGVKREFPIDEIKRSADKFSTIGRALKSIAHDFKKKTGPECVRLITAFGTEFVVGGKVFAKLMNSACNLYVRAGSQLKTLAQNLKKEMTLEQVIACAEGVEVEIAAAADLFLEKAVEQSAEMAGHGEVIGVRAAQIAEEFKAWESTLGGRTSLISAGEGNVIKKFTKDIVESYWGHVFSDKHIVRNILKLGENRSDIMNKFINKIIEADLKNLLMNGDNHIETVINSLDVTIKAFIKKGEVMSINGYTGHAVRKIPNIIKL